MTKTKINFSVDNMAVLCNIMDGDIKGRMYSKNNPEKKKLYQKLGVINSTPVVIKFLKKYQEFFVKKKFITAKRNIFEEILPISSEYGKVIYKKEVARIVEYTYDLEPEDKKILNSFLEDFWKLSTKPEIQKIIQNTSVYRDKIEEIWRDNEEFVMKSVETILGYEPEPQGTICTYIMYPNFNIHRTCQGKSNQTNLFFGKMQEKNPNKIIAYIAHQVVHQPMLPYKATMTKKQKEEFHAFIKFLTDKEVYYRLTGKSYLDITTQNENPEIMAKIYPYWLGYKYRNIDKFGKNPIEQITKSIQRDKKYFERLPEKSKKRKLYEGYEFEKIDPEKLVAFFREKRGITPYQFAKIDFDNKKLIYKDEYLNK